MKFWKVSAIVAPALLLLCSCSAGKSAPSAPAVKDSASSEAAAPTATTAEVQPVNNKKCPVSGEPVGSMEKDAHIDYNGYRVGLCCKGCIDVFNQDPQKFLAKAQQDATPPS